MLPTKLEPIPLPDPRRPTRTPPLPAWVTTQKNALATNLQIDTATGRFADVMTLPFDQMPTTEQWGEIEAHIHSLTSLLDQVPERSAEWEKATLVIVTKMLLVLGGKKDTEVSAEAKAEAYMMALDDVPWWGVDGAARAWYRKECGPEHDYRWMPDPGTLRECSRHEAFKISARIREFQSILNAKPFVDCSAEIERGAAAYIGLLSCGSDVKAMKGLTFDSAVEIGSKIIAEKKEGAPDTKKRDAA